MGTRSLRAFIVCFCALTGVNASAPQLSGGIVHLASELAKSEHGRVLLQKAFKRWSIQNVDSIEGHLVLGEISKTDATLTRHFDSETGAESRIREVRVIIRSDQSLQDQVLDLAHELTHATHDPSWDPYDPELNALNYVKASIEGPGGEADAVANECRVAQDLGWLDQHSARRCNRYRLNKSEPAKNDIDRSKILADFYRVGKFISFVRQRLGHRVRELAYLSSESAELLSSTGKTPYPVALVREYEELTRIACENSRRRIASEDSDETNRQLLSKRCAVSKTQAL